MLKHFRWPLLTSVVVVGASFAFLGWQAGLIVAILCVLEISFSFDNAVVNATVLERMSPAWQRLFLTVGILIAVFGMRFVFPIAIVSVTAALSPGDVLQLALNDKQAYADKLLSAHDTIAAFGGAFLLMIALDFIFEDRDRLWLRRLESVMLKLGGIQGLSVVLTLGCIAFASRYLAHDAGETILFSGIFGLVSYLVVNGLAGFFESEGDEDDDELAGISGPASRASGAKAVVGKAAFFLFLYLEVLDASFSFDGVIGAFAITNDIVIIAIGLGIGAIFVRSMTIYLVRKGTLSEYVYLEHGAHYAIGALALVLFATMRFHIDEWVTGLIGLVFIAAAFLSSVRHNKKEGVAA
jgi:hypothetical protein